jgi:peptidoglycan/LPS O-acetylase OafA/YrhL
MQGALRLYLAACVVHAHMWIYPGIAPMDLPWNPAMINGATAVMCFFALSGFVAGLQIETKFKERNRVNMWAYYRDRLLRIYPTYLLVVALAAPIYFMWSDAGPRTDWLLGWNAASFALVNLLPPALDLGQAYLGHGFEYAVTPVAWSLGAELCFYAAAPFLFLAGRSLWLLPLLVALALIELLSHPREALTNYLDPLLNLKYFVAGLLAYLACSRLRPLRSLAWWIPAGLVIAFGWMTLQLAWQMTPPNGVAGHTFMAGMLAFVAASHLWVRASRLDLLLGHLSYPLFIAHVPVMWLVRRFNPGSPEKLYFAVWILALATSILIYVGFDRAVNVARKSRQRPSQRPDLPATSPPPEKLAASPTPQSEP